MSDHVPPSQSLRMETLLPVCSFSDGIVTLTDIELPNPAESPGTLHIPCPDPGDCFLSSKVEGMPALRFHALILPLHIGSVLCAGKGLCVEGMWRTNRNEGLMVGR